MLIHTLKNRADAKKRMVEAKVFSLHYKRKFLYYKVEVCRMMTISEQINDCHTASVQDQLRILLAVSGVCGLGGGDYAAVY